ncbi:MAG: ATP-binding cassette domain-containing protein [Zoogloeaceae bacterium]|jgi:lipooligosaccharide transport system ATP-binding protein|nr:ATP-binding cassette domain-containing protein [Zoogloeaceae bacterium]
MPETVVAAPLAVSGLRKSYGGTPVIDGLSFSLGKGQCFGLLGPNGAGKTTTLKLCLGLAVPDAGEIRLAGHPIPGEAKAARARIGVVPQFDNLDPDFTVRENLIVFARYFKVAQREILARLPWLLQFSGLESKAEVRINTLSGGMKRRLTLARALVADPDILFLDEPTTGLDPQARHLIWERLKALKSAGKTLLLTTHFMDEADRLCDTLMIIDQGREIAAGSPGELIARHIEPEVVEVYDAVGGNELERFLPRWQGESPAIRIERSGETAFCYCRDAQPLLASLASFADTSLRYIHRASNLEDVFIKLTGRELRD